MKFPYHQAFEFYHNLTPQKIFKCGKYTGNVKSSPKMFLKLSISRVYAYFKNGEVLH